MVAGVSDPAALVQAVEAVEARLCAVGEQLATELRRLTETLELVAQIEALDERKPEARGGFGS